MKRIGRAVIVGTAVLFGSAAFAQQAPEAKKPVPTREQVEKRLTSVGTLIERSSAAKQIEASGVGEAASHREAARKMHQEADAAFRAGDYVKATQLLEAASKRMFEGVRLAAPEKVTGDKKRQDFDARMESVRALVGALKRVNEEKKKGGSGQELVARIETMIKESEQLAAEGKLERAKARIDQAYMAAKVGIGELREGDTLVRTLKFESKEEEYHYELDRNDTHQMLVKVLVDEKRDSGNFDKAIDVHVEKAMVLRKQAEKEAGGKDFDSAIKTLEDSTSELVRAIRRAGIYIPG